MRNRVCPVVFLLIAAPAAFCQAAPPRPFPANVPASPIPQQSTELPRTEDFTAFDPGRVDLKWQDEQWVLVTNDGVLKDFGRREEDARRAWRLMRELGLTQRAVIGKPQPVLEYWLCAGKPPTSVPRGLRLIALDPAALRIEQSQGFWVLRDATRVLFNFGVHETEARQALAVVRKYGFNQIAIVGQAVPSMVILIARPDLQTATPLMTTEPRDRATTRSRVIAAKAEQSGTPKPADNAGFYPTPMIPALSSGNVVTHGRQSAADRRAPGGSRLTSQTAGRTEEHETSVVSERVPFDWRQVCVQRQNGEWKLAAGGYTFARFGTNERDARIAQAAMLHYRFTELNLVGGPESPAGYFLANGQAPCGLMVGVFSDRFRPDQLAVRAVNAHFWLSDGSRPLLDCGEREENAQHMLNLIRRHGFDHLCRIGSDSRQSLSFFVRSY